MKTPLWRFTVCSAKTSVESKNYSDRPTSRFMLDEVTSCPFGREQMIRHILRCAVSGSDKSFAHLVLNRRYVMEVFVTSPLFFLRQIGNGALKTTTKMSTML